MQLPDRLTSANLYTCVQEGKGQWSSTETAQMAAVPPESPSPPTVMGSNRTSVSIRWQAPEGDGGSAVSSYEVELRPKSKASLAGMTDEWLTVYQVSPHEYGLLPAFVYLNCTKIELCCQCWVS